MGWFYFFSVIEHVHYGAYVTGSVCFVWAVILMSIGAPDVKVGDVPYWATPEDKSKLLDAYAEQIKSTETASDARVRRLLAVVAVCSFVAAVTPTLEQMLQQRVSLQALGATQDKPVKK